MDTFKEKQELEDIYGQGKAPWAVWLNGSRTPSSGDDINRRPANGRGRAASVRLQEQI